jgi:hypothetical protein
VASVSVYFRTFFTAGSKGISAERIASAVVLSWPDKASHARLSVSAAVAITPHFVAAIPIFQPPRLCIMSNPRLPIKVVRIPGGAILRFANGESLYIYGRDPEIASQAHAMTLEAAETLAKDVARTLTDAWSQSD